MGVWGDYKHAMAMVGLQMGYAAVALVTRAAMLQGMSPRVLVVYRQAVATLAVAPVAYLCRIAINQNIYYEGLYLATSATASAMANLVPAITFVMASIVGANASFCSNLFYQQFRSKYYTAATNDNSTI
ncbi:hypothetical protein F3Y22_tig00111238pilonHSYRG00439 [Hibiscus syriacus]|uniref:WAT1-related protein n=1 Tax=Hibiscus syriacus TaxID=106335 RepID=A0A6A2YUM5_HIBSY|nr:hypothetical protein F3Y22_tig00111238pilonHSYRG00439 [Hibiscus syriacus]